MKLLKTYRHVEDLVLRIPLGKGIVIITLPANPELQLFPYGVESVDRLIKKGDWVRNVIGSKL